MAGEIASVESILLACTWPSPRRRSTRTFAYLEFPLGAGVDPLAIARQPRHQSRMDAGKFELATPSLQQRVLITLP
jgi:hypothetical protein